MFKIDIVSSYDDKICNYLNTDVGGALLNKKEFKEFIKKHKELGSINPDDLNELYKETGIKFEHIFDGPCYTLTIDPFSIEVEGKSYGSHGFFKYNRYKSNIISKIEEKIDYRYELISKVSKIEDKDKKIGCYEKIIDIERCVYNLGLDLDNDVTVITHVHDINYVDDYKIIVDGVVFDLDNILKEKDDID